MDSLKQKDVPAVKDLVLPRLGEVGAARSGRADLLLLRPDSVEGRRRLYSAAQEAHKGPVSGELHIVMLL